MFIEIKKKIDKELNNYARGLDKLYSLKKVSPVLHKHITEYILREGKRVRPILFCIGYLGFAKKAAPGLYHSAISIELLHDFMLVHDDIIDKSPTRRGQPAMHTMLKSYTGRDGKFSASDLGICVGDIMYAMALETFLAVKENPSRKEAAMRRLIQAALYTGGGEFIELVYGAKDISAVKRADIYKIYDLKTANYTFASPLAIGATLAGADKKQINILINYGNRLGRAFQIKDDILGMFSEEKETGKSSLADLKEGKRTVLIWYAYNNSPQGARKSIKRLLGKKNAGAGDLIVMRKLLKNSGALDYAKKEIASLKNEAGRLLGSSSIKKAYKETLHAFADKIL